MSGRRARERRYKGSVQAQFLKRSPKTLVGLVRSGRVGRADLAARVPWVNALADSSVALFGLGSLGAPAALELARNGLADLRVLDGDLLDSATISRWPFGVSFAGAPKVAAIHAIVASNWPWTVVHPELRHLGRIRDQDQESEGSVLNRMLEGVNLVFDATAEYGVSYLLSELAWERKIPYVSITAEHGAWGGTVLAIRPGKSGCWMCYQGRIIDGTIPRPPGDPKGATQPEGCAAPTFTGASFDLLPIVAEGTRTVVSILTAKAMDSYPQFDWDVAVGSLRTADGIPTPPTWRSFDLFPHPKCPRSH
jgi:molybdopterin/thiamine biosynthesis adenylyltransferase